MPSSYMANMANSGNAGGSNASSTSAGWFFPDRLNLPFVTAPDTGPGKAPPQTVGQLPIVPVPRFPSRNWATEWYAWLALVEFSATNWQTINPATQPNWPNWVPPPSALPAPAAPSLDWNTLNVRPNPGDPFRITQEVDDLVTAASDERPDALGEILAQSDEFISTFLNAMSARPASHPYTTQVLGIASLVATLVVMRFKVLYSRPRPSQLCPALLPPIAVPGHASFPSGHSTQAHLMALCMADVLGNPAPQDTRVDVLWTLADRIARNREIAGLHYASDSAAGIALARGIMLKLNSAAVPSYQAAVAGAKGEWA